MGGRKLLIIEDDIDLREGLHFLFTGDGYVDNNTVSVNISRLRTKIEISDVKEGKLSALVHKIHRIQEVLGKQIEKAEEEKEQVKSLVSNMSHQLRTPLANLSIYTEFLCSQELEEEKKEEAAGKIKKQIDKLDWIIGSLAKMVKLEQDVIAFDAEGISIRKTILDAVSMRRRLQKYSNGFTEAGRRNT